MESFSCFHYSDTWTLFQFTCFPCTRIDIIDGARLSTTFCSRLEQNLTTLLIINHSTQQSYSSAAKHQFFCKIRIIDFVLYLYSQNAGAESAQLDMHNIIVIMTVKIYYCKQCIVIKIEFLTYMLVGIEENFNFHYAKWKIMWLLIVTEIFVTF